MKITVMSAPRELTTRRDQEDCNLSDLSAGAFLPTGSLSHPGFDSMKGQGLGYIQVVSKKFKFVQGRGWYGTKEQKEKSRF